MPIVAADPFGSFIAGKQARQQEAYGETRNALAQQDLETGQLRNRMVQDQYSQQQVQQALQQTAATASRLAQSPDVRRELAMYPEFAQGLQKQHPEIAQMDDGSLRQYLGFVAGQAQSKLGVGPAAPAAYTLKPGEARFEGNQVVASRPGVPKEGESGFTLSPGQTRFGPDGKPIANVAAAPDVATTQQNFQRADKLRDEFNNQSKEFIGVANSYQRILDSAADPSAAGDLSLIFNYMKVLDPGSTVREGEFATAQQAGSIPARVVAQYNKVLNGERLAPEQRTDFVDRADRLYKGQETRWKKNTRDRYETLARQLAGIDPKYVIGDFSVPQAPAAQQPGAAPAAELTATGPSGEKIVLRGGQWVPLK